VNVGKSQKAPASPPVVHSVSPPVQKPSTPVNGNSANYKGTTTQSNKNKNTVFFTPSKNSVNNITSLATSIPSSTFTSTKLNQQQTSSSGTNYSTSQYQHQTHRTTTPTKAVTPTFGSSPPTATPPPVPSSPTGQNLGQSQHKGVGYMVPTTTMPSTAQSQTFSTSYTPLGPITNTSQQVLNRAPGSQNGPQNYNTGTQQQQSVPISTNQTPTLNLAPGSNTSMVIAPPGSARAAPVPET